MPILIEDADCPRQPHDFWPHHPKSAGGTNIVTRVVRRSEENLTADRINTSEFFEQVFQVPDKVEPKVSIQFCVPNVIDVILISADMISTPASSSLLGFKVKPLSRDRVSRVEGMQCEFGARVHKTLNFCHCSVQVKASQCFTKYKWRSPQEAAQTGGPLIVATQVVSDYLTPYDGEALMLRARNKPIVVYTYNMSFRRMFKSYEA